MPYPPPSPQNIYQLIIAMQEYGPQISSSFCFILNFYGTYYQFILIIYRDSYILSIYSTFLYV